MFLKDKEIEKVLNTIRGITPEDEVLKDMKAFFMEEFNIVIFDYLCDRLKDGLLRLKIMVWDGKDMKMFFCNSDRVLEDKIKDRFSRSCREHGLNSEFYDPKDYFAVVSSFRPDLEKSVMNNETLKKIDELLRKYPEVKNHRYAIPTVFVFYEKEKDIETYRDNGLSSKIREEISGVLGSVSGLEGRSLGDIRFSSLELFKGTYKGNFYGFWLDN